MKTTESIRLKLDNKRPSLKSAITKAVFTSSSTLWSDTTATWSSISALWGGSDRKQTPGPMLHSVGYESSVVASNNSGYPIGLLLSLTHA